MREATKRSASVGAGYTKSVMDYALSRGANLQALVEQSGIRLEDLGDRDKRIPFHRHMALIRAAKDLCGDPAFALHYGAQSLFDEISIVGLICFSSGTMAEAFDQLNRYARLVIDYDDGDGRERFAFIRRESGLWLEFRHGGPREHPEITESTFARFAADCASYLPEKSPFIRLAHVRRAEPSYREEYVRVLMAPVVFDCERDELLIDESWLSVRGPYADRYVFGVYSERAETLLKSLESATTIKGQVESALIAILHKGEPGMSEIAGKLGVSRTSLYRKLKAEGVSFEGLLDDLRLDMALHYLGERKVTVNETAYLVGFSDPSAFSRAFKRWTGSSPRAARTAKGALRPTGLS